MAEEIRIKFTIDGITKEVSSLEELNSELAKIDKNAKGAAKGLDDAADATKDLGKESEKTDKKTGFLSEKIDGIKDTFGKLKNDAKGVASGFVNFAKGLGLSAKASKGLAVGLSALGIPIILAAIAALIDYFSNFEGAAKLVQKALAAAGAVIRKVTEAVMALLKGDFTGAKNAIAGIGEAASQAAKGVDELFEAQRALEKLQKQQVIENAKLRQSIEAQKKILEDSTQTYEDRIAALKQVNAGTEQLAKNEIAMTEATLRSLKAQLALEKNYEKRIELEQQIADAQADLIDKQTELQNIQFDAAKVERELQQQRRDEQQAAYEKQLEIARNYQNQLTTLEQNNELARIADDDARAQRKIEIDRENAIKGIKEAEFNEKQKRELIKAINEQYDLEEQARQKAVEDREAAKAEEKRKKEEEKAKQAADKAKADADKLREILQAADLASIEDAFMRAQEELRIQEEKQLAELDALGATEEQKQKIAALYTKKREQLAKDEADYKKKLEEDVQAANLEVASQAFGAVAALVGENTAVGKAAAVAATTIDTYLAAQKAYTSQLLPGDPTSPIRGAIAAGVAVATGIANVRKILATPTPGAAGGAATGGAGPTKPSVPTFNPGEAIAGATQGAENQSAAGVQQTGSSAQVIKAYVVATEMTSEQEKNKQIEDLSKL